LCFCFETDSSPPEDYPGKQPNERRFFHYTNTTKVLGVKRGKRAKLPKCVQRRIAEMYPDSEGAATKEGYKQVPKCEMCLHSCRVCDLKQSLLACFRPLYTIPRLWQAYRNPKNGNLGVAKARE